MLGTSRREPSPSLPTACVTTLRGWDLTFTSTSRLWYHPGVTESIPATPAEAPPAKLLRIQEVAAETGLTTRAIRYYEELGLLEPAARSDGAYRLYDESDLERLRFIRSLRDDAGFSLAQVGQLLEDEAARERNRERFRSTQDVDERRAIVDDARARVERQIATLRAKRDRLDSMIAEAEQRRDHLGAHRVELDGGPDPHPERHR
jgi:DNA-binding transcriptional MerR regulator